MPDDWCKNKDKYINDPEWRKRNLNLLLSYPNVEFCKQPAYYSVIG
jgi:hypothetical protein